MGINIADTSIDFTGIKKHQQQIVKVAALGAHKMLVDARVETKQGIGEIISSQEVHIRDHQEASRKSFSQKTLLSPGALSRKCCRK